MTQIPRDREHIVDLLPAYVNGQLDASSASLVREHLVSCTSCRVELMSWEALKETVRDVYAVTPLPSPQLMDQVWAKIAQPEEVYVAQRRGLMRTLRHAWQIFHAQIPLIHKSLWLVSALVCLLALVLVLLMPLHTFAQKHEGGNLLVLFIVVAGASGCAFLYGSAVDPGFELAIATPTSVRFMMISRMVIVLGYNMLLGIIASALFAGFAGGSLWEMMQLWLGPLLFLSSLCLAISLFVSSAFALICTVALEALQAFPSVISVHLGLSLPPLDLSSTNPTLLIGAFLRILCSVFFLPRQPRLAS